MRHWVHALHGQSSMKKCDVTRLYAKHKQQGKCNTSLHQAITILQNCWWMPGITEGLQQIPGELQWILGWVLKHQYRKWTFVKGSDSSSSISRMFVRHDLLDRKPACCQGERGDILKSLQILTSTLRIWKYRLKKQTRHTFWIVWFQKPIWTGALKIRISQKNQEIGKNAILELNFV